VSAVVQGSPRCLRHSLLSGLDRSPWLDTVSQPRVPRRSRGAEEIYAVDASSVGRCTACLAAGGTRFRTITFNENVRKTRSLDSAVDGLARELKYPIESAADMRAAVADMEATVAGVSMRFEDFAAVLPIWWFPIVSQENFKEKALELAHNKAFRAAVLANMGRSTVRLTRQSAPMAGPAADSPPLEREEQQLR
jgi:hypothetical protein